MARTCIRLAPETSEKLQAEARKLSELSGKTVTVSDLLRACIREKFPEVSRLARRENAVVRELQEEVGRLGERLENLTRAVEILVEKLTVEFREISTRQQIKTLEDALIQVLQATSSRR